MKTIGLVGGTSWESTMEYYRIINQETAKRAGARHSAKIVMFSIDFFEVETLINAGNMNGVAGIMINAASKVQNAGADCVLMCANTTHLFAGPVQLVLRIPLIHIAEMTLNKVMEKNFKRVGLIGTKPTMERDF